MHIRAKETPVKEREREREEMVKGGIFPLSQKI